MESLKLVTDNRRSLYFSKYKYRAKCKVMGAAYTYYTSSLKEFKEKMEKRSNKNPARIHVILNDWRSQIDTIDYDQIGTYFAWRNLAPRDKYLCRIQGNLISFFSDDLSLLQTLNVLDPNLEISEAVVNFSEVIHFRKEPKFKFRTYFKGKKAPDNFKEEVRSFIDTYDHIACMCPAMKRLVSENSPKRYWSYFHSSYYVDYNEESTLTLLHMFFGPMLAKTYRLEKEPQN